MQPHRSAVGLLIATLALGACGTTVSTPTASLSPSPAAIPSTAPSPSPSPIATTPASSSPVIKVATVTLRGATRRVLTDGQGLALYYKPADTPTGVTCTGGCAANWPPMLFPNGTPTGTAEVPGTLTTFSGPNGIQVLYNGHPLYRWFRDGAGEVTGDGIGGFKVATPELTAG